MTLVKKITQKGIHIVTSHKIISALVMVVLLGGGYFAYKASASSSGKISYITQPVAKDSVVVSVSGSGQVSPENQLDVKSKASSTITYIGVKNGQYVKQGTLLVALDAGDQQQALKDAELNLQSAQNDYDNAKLDLATTQQEQTKSLNDQLLAINSNVSPIPDIANTLTTGLTISGSYDSTERGRYTMKIFGCQAGVCVKYSGLEEGTFPVIKNVPELLGTRGLYATFTTLPGVSDVWYLDVPSPSTSDYSANERSYEDKKQSTQDAIDAAQRTVTLRQLALAQKQNALVEAKRNLADFAIYAPFSGIVANVPFKVHDSISSGAAVVTLITNQSVTEIPLNEIDVTRVKIGQKATLTFDAIDGLTIVGQIADIDTLGTVNQGVVNYNVKIVFANEDSRVKPGMSVDANIITDVAQDVLVVPNSALKTQGGQSYVQVLNNSKPENKMVQTGLSNDTDTEITSGLSEGDNVVTQTMTTTKKTTTSTQNSFFNVGGGGARTGGGGGFTGGGAGGNRGATQTR